MLPPSARTDSEATSPSPDSRQVPPGAGRALSLLLLINLFNYIDRYVLAAVEPEIRNHFFPGDSENARAKSGLLAAALLGVGRAVGETMAVLMATGHAVQIPHGLLDSVRTLTANIAAELGEAPAGSDHYRVLFVTGLLLFTLTFAVNLTADLVIRGVRRR